MPSTSVLTIVFSVDTVGTGTFTLKADGVVVSTTNPQDFSSYLTFETGVIYQGQALTLDYEPGDVVGTPSGCPLAAFSGMTIYNNSTVLWITPSSTIDLSSPADPNTYDSFRVYLDAEPTHRWEGTETQITFADLGAITDGDHTMYTTTVNVAGESLASPTTAFKFSNSGGP